MNDITTFYSELLIIRHTFQHAGGPIPDALEDLLKTVGKVARCAARRKAQAGAGSIRGRRGAMKSGNGKPSEPRRAI